MNLNKLKQTKKERGKNIMATTKVEENKKTNRNAQKEMEGGVE